MRSKLAFCAFFVSFGTTLNMLSTTMIRTTEAVEAVVVVKSAKKTKVHSHEAAPPPPTTTTTTTVSSLFVQVGKPCSMAQHADGFYTLRATIGEATVSFSERPNRLAGNVPTKKFVESYEELFASSNPNAAITFADNGPLIVVLSHPKIVASRLKEEDDSTTNFVIEYTMEQTESQGEVASIEEFLNTSGSCSIFIDSVLSLQPLEYAPSTDTCFSDKDNPDKYCWYIKQDVRRKTPYPAGQWETVNDRGNNKCGRMCTKFARMICSGLGDIPTGAMNIRSDINPEAGQNLRSKTSLENMQIALEKRKELKNRSKTPKRDDLCE